MRESRSFGIRHRGTVALGLAVVICFTYPQPGAAAITGGSEPAPSAQARSSTTDIFPLSILWMVTLDTPPALAPAFDDERAYVALKADVEGGRPIKRIAAYSLTDGSRKWTRDAPDVDGLETGSGLLFACAGPRLEALLAADGSPRWHVSLDAPLSAPLQAAGGWLIALTQASHAYAIRAVDGARLWDVHLPSPATGPPALLGDAVFLPLTDNRVVRLDLQSGALVWTRSLLSQPTCLLALDNRVFVGTNERWFYALSPQNGRVEWRFRVGGPVVGTPAAGPSTVYFLALDNLLRALDRAGGSLRWRQMLARRARFGPFQLGSLLVVSGLSQVIQAYNVHGGTPAGTFETPHDLFTPAHPIAGLVDRDFLLIAVTGQGELLAIRPHSLQPEEFAWSPRVYVMAGFPYWIY